MSWLGLCFVLFFKMVSLYSPGCPCAQVGLELRDPASATWDLGVLECDLSSAFVLVSFIWEEGTSMCPHHIVCTALSRLVIDMGASAHCGCCHSRASGLASCKKAGWANCGKQASDGCSSTSAALSSYLDFPQWQTVTSKCKPDKPSPSRIVFGHVYPSNRKQTKL